MENTNPFYELRNRLYKTAAAGCSIISEDHRLKRAVEDFETFSSANKVFGRLYSMCCDLLTAEDPASKIADCIALADALTVTQGTYKNDTPTEQLTNNIECVPRPIDDERLETYRHYITSSYDSYDLDEKFRSAIHDPRLISTFLMRNGSVSKTIAESFIYEFGNTLAKPIFDMIDISDPKAGGKSITLIRMLDTKEYNDKFAEIAADDTLSSDLRAQAVYAIADEEHEELLTNIFRTSKGKVKAAALLSLAYLNSDAVEEHLEKKVFTSSFSIKKEADLDLLRSSGGNAAESFITQMIQRQIASDNLMLDDHITIDNILTGIRNKKGIEDLLIQLGVYFGKNSRYEETSQKRLNNILIEDMLTHEDIYFTERIYRLYEKCPDVFKAAKFAADLVSCPEKAVELTDAKRSGYRRMCLEVLTNVHTTPDGAYGYYYDDISPVCLRGCRILFDRIPETLLRFIADEGSIPTNNLIKKLLTSKEEKHEIDIEFATRCLILMTLMKKAPEQDAKRIKRAAEQFAWTTVDHAPRIDVLPLLANCTDRPLEGVLYRTIIFTVKEYKTFIYRVSIESSRLPESVIYNDIDKAIKELTEHSILYDKNIAASQIRELERIIK